MTHRTETAKAETVQLHGVGHGQSPTTGGGTHPPQAALYMPVGRDEIDAFLQKMQAQSGSVGIRGRLFCPAFPGCSGTACHGINSGDIHNVYKSDDLYHVHYNTVRRGGKIYKYRLFSYRSPSICSFCRSAVLLWVKSFPAAPSEPANRPSGDPVQITSSQYLPLAFLHIFLYNKHSSPFLFFISSLRPFFASDLAPNGNRRKAILPRRGCRACGNQIPPHVRSLP